jgi:hypothetical protein
MAASSLDDDPPPVPPERPSGDDCCKCGCTPCVFDLFEEAMERHREALAKWEERQAQRKGS